MLKITLNYRELRRIQTALQNIKQEAKRQLVSGGGSFNRLCAIDYNQLLLKNIFSRTSPSPAYTEKYAKWKKKKSLMGYPSPWRLSGDLVHALGIFRSDIGWASGLPAKIFSSGRLKGQREIATYAKTEEKRRPIFKPTATEYEVSSTRQNRVNELLQKVSAQWR